MNWAIVAQLAGFLPGAAFGKYAGEQAADWYWNTFADHACRGGPVLDLSILDLRPTMACVQRIGPFESRLALTAAFVTLGCVLSAVAVHFVQALFNRAAN